MMKENQNIELFERYRNGELSETELNAFNARLVYDSEFQEEFEQYKQLETGIKNHFRTALKSQLQALDEQLDVAPKKSNTIRLVQWSTSVAAAALIGFFIFQYFSKNNSHELAQHYWPYEAGLPVKMSSKGKYDEAMNAFKLGKWEEAKKNLQTIDSDTSNYFLGIISYEQKDFQQAINFFKKVNSNSAYYSASQFRMALVFILEDKLSEATTTLTQLNSKNTVYSPQIKELLQKLEK